MHSELNFSDMDSPFTNYLYSEKFHYSLIVTCSMSVFIAKNIEYDFEKLMDIASIEPYGSYSLIIMKNIDLWNPLNFFIHFDSVIPITLKLQLLEVEVAIITELTWKKNYSFHKKITEIPLVLNHCGNLISFLILSVS